MAFRSMLRLREREADSEVAEMLQRIRLADYTWNPTVRKNIDMAMREFYERRSQ